MSYEKINGKLLFTIHKKLDLTINKNYLEYRNETVSQRNKKFLKGKYDSETKKTTKFI